MNLLKNKNGFTLVELIFIVVVVGILTAVAISKFVDLRRDAANGAARGVLGALRSENTLIYSQRLTRGTSGSYTNNNTMRYIALSMLRAPTTRGYGFSWTAAARTFTMTVGGMSYRFSLNPYPNVPTNPGRITVYAVGTIAAGTLTTTFRTW